MAVGLACWFSYQLVWTYVEVIQRNEVPDLFSWDALLFLHFVPMMAALALQPNVEAHDRDWRSGSLDFALLLLWWVYVYVYSVIPWQFSFANPVAYQLNLNTSYLVEKVALLGGLALLWYRSCGGWKTIYGTLVHRQPLLFDEFLHSQLGAGAAHLLFRKFVRRRVGDFDGMDERAWPARARHAGRGNQICESLCRVEFGRAGLA